MRFSIANLLLLGAAVAAPVYELDRREETQYGDIVSRGLVPIILPRAVVPIKVPPKVPVKPPPTHPVDAPPVLPDPINPAEPVRAPGSPDAPPKNPNEPEAPPRLTGETPPKAPVDNAPGASCSLKRGTCRPGAKADLKIDETYDRTIEPLESGKTADVAKKAGLDNPNAKWQKATMDNGPDARKQFDEKILPDYEKNYNPANNPKSPFKEDWQYEMFLDTERTLFGTATGHKQPFIQSQNNHGENPTMVIEQMFKERDLYNGCKGCQFEAAGVTFDRPPLTRPQGTPEVFTSQGLADDWRVTAAAAKADPKKIDNFASNNVDTPESKQIFQGLFKDGETDKTFAKGTPEFAEVEKTVQAKVVKRMLDTEKDTFGTKEITEHRVIKDGFTWHLTSKSVDVPAA